MINMNDNYFMDDLVGSLERDIVMERYYPLIDRKGELTTILNRNGAVRKEQVTDDVVKDIRVKLGNSVADLFIRFIRIYDFNASKLREIKGYAGTKRYDDLAKLLRLPGVRILRAELYINSGVNLVRAKKD